MKKKYEKPTLKVVKFKVERGYYGSVTGLSHEGFEGELWGNECFEDQTPTNINDESIEWHIF